MPELPEVETVRQELESFLIGRKVTEIENPSNLGLRKPVNWPKEKIGISGVSRWGKRLFINLGDEKHFDVSLGMTGSFRREKCYRPKLHDHVVFRLEDQKLESSPIARGVHLIYNDPRRFGWIQYRSEAPVMKGWDPILSSSIEKKELIQKMKSSKKDLYSFLMDQTHIVGLGNIYVQEALFRAKAYPFKRAHKTSYKKLSLIIDKAQEVLREALNHKGTTIINYKSATGQQGGFQNKLQVYGKTNLDKCSLCTGPLKKVKKARSVSFCRYCQK